MSRAVLLSVDPEWAEALLEGLKEWEYRRVAPACDPPYVAYLYATAPQQEVVGTVVVDEVLGGPIEKIIEPTVEDTPHSPDDLREYFDGRDTGTALHATTPNRFADPISSDTLQAAVPTFVPPQNFTYLDSMPGIRNAVPEETVA